MPNKKPISILKGIVAFVSICCLTPGRATIIHAIDVAALVESSDLIISGRVTSTSQQGPTHITLPGGSIPGESFLAIISVDETLKGELENANVPVEFAVPDAPAGIRGIPNGQYGIFFLQKRTSGYGVSDPLYPFLPALPGGRPSLGLPLDRVIKKLGEVVGESASTPTEISSALEALARIQGKVSTETLRRALESSTGTVKLQVASKLVARNDLNGLEPVETALLRPGPEHEQLFPVLAGSLSGLKDPKSIPALKRLLRANNPMITKSVVIALRQSGAKEAIGPLSHLLENSDEQVRYYAVVGLGEITGQDEWTPTFAEFRRNETKYLSYWRDWAASNTRQETSN